jgi:hypothetical protein
MSSFQQTVSQWLGRENLESSIVFGILIHRARLSLSKRKDRALDSPARSQLLIYLGFGVLLGLGRIWLNVVNATVREPYLVCMEHFPPG